MKRLHLVWMLALAAAVVMMPSVAIAQCIQTDNIDGYSVPDGQSNKITLESYDEGPVADVSLRDCSVADGDDVWVPYNMCPGDEIIVNGNMCTISGISMR